jgi:hypothetical protein
VIGDPVSELASIATKLIGATCWKVSAGGGATGSRFILHFGAGLKWAVDPKNPPLNSRLKDTSHGEFRLHVGCAAWRLDSDDKPLTAWTDLAVPGGPMFVGLSLLQGCVVVGAEIVKPGLDLILSFDKRYVLRVFCDQFEEPFDNYSLSFRNTYVEVRARSRARIEVSARETEGDDAIQ